MEKWLKEIGSEFNLSLKVLTKPQVFDLSKFLGLDSSGYILFRGGRTALHYYLKHLAPFYDGEYLLPAYLCEAVLRPFEFESVKFNFYHINENLQIDLADLKARVNSKTKGILIIHYFGFPQPEEIMDYLESLRDQGIDIIEDMTQAFFTTKDDIGRKGNYALASFRKFVPIPDGGILYSFREKMTTANVAGGYDKYFRKRLQGLLWKNFYLARGGSKGFLKSFRQGENYYDRDAKIHGMTGFSRLLLKKTEKDCLFEKRRQNFLTLLQGCRSLQGIRPLFTNLPSGVCPLGFPILAGRRREQLRDFLIEHRVFPPVHWELPKQVNPVVYNKEFSLSCQILTIPCDQRYDTADMQNILGFLELFCKNARYGMQVVL